MPTDLFDAAFQLIDRTLDLAQDPELGGEERERLVVRARKAYLEMRRAVAGSTSLRVEQLRGR